MDEQKPQDSDGFGVPVSVINNSEEHTVTNNISTEQNTAQEVNTNTHGSVVSPVNDIYAKSEPATESAFQNNNDNYNQAEPIKSPMFDRAAVVSSAYPSFEPSQSKPEPAFQPVASSSMNTLEMPADDRPVPVVKVLSVRGVEYAMMSILLWIGAGTLIFILVSLILGTNSFDALAFPISMLLVCAPAFAFFFIRLRSAELRDPSLRLEASKRRFSQLTQIFAFLTCLFNLVTIVYLIIGMAGGTEVDNFGKILGAAAVVMIIAGGILTYYWFDEHKLVRR